MPDRNRSNSGDKWEPFRFFLGSWTGNASGKPGTGTSSRSYSLTLADQFIEVRDRSVYPAQDANPSGEVHEDMGMISYDERRSCYVLREFHVEGYVNQYTLQAPIDGTTFVFQTEAIENIPPGWQARTTLAVLSEDAFRETFELAGPEAEWVCYITIEFSRVRAYRH